MPAQSLSFRHNPLAAPENQLDILENQTDIVPFAEKLAQEGLGPLHPSTLDTFQINIGKMCNQVCAHCHVDAGPDRKEVMTRATMQHCLDVLSTLDVKTVDLTGGAPEMNPDFRWFVTSLRAIGKRVIVRCNLTIIVANKRFNDLPEFYKQHAVEVVSSLPFYRADRTDRQRGEGVFEQSIKALQMLNAVGYGQPGSTLVLNLVYNPAGAFLPPDQQQLERDFKKELYEHHGIVFNKLFCITNMPVSRYLEYLVRTGNYERYMERLLDAFNPRAAENVMCRTTISVSWDGYLYDCDFNQMLDMKVEGQAQHISAFNKDAIGRRTIRVNQHCYGCTAGTGSSCSGSIV